MSRRRKPWRGVWRKALPPLHDKEVELISIIPYLLGPNRYEIKLMVDGKRYAITKRNCTDELAAMVWLTKLRTQVSKRPNAAKRQGANT